MNKDLYGKHFQLDDEMIKHLSQYKNEPAISSLLGSKSISYSKAKKLKHEIEKNGKKNQLGGDKFYNWLNQTLTSKRDGIHRGKEQKKEAGLPNAFLSSHSKDGVKDMNRPSQSHHANNDEIKINEALKRINELISKII